MKSQLMLRAFLAAGTAILLSASAEIAKADTINASLFSSMAPSGATPVSVDLSGITAPSNSTINGPGYTVTFATAAGQGVVQGSLSGQYAVPVAGATGAGNSTPEYLTDGFGSMLTTEVLASGNYFSTGLGTITITFDVPEISLALLWGSIDTGNWLTLNDADNFKVTGTEVQQAAAGFVSNGYQGPGGSAYVLINSDSSFTSVTLGSDVMSFESSALAASSQPFTNPTPEPASMALIGGGLCLAALIGRRKLNAKKD
jgi:hypothetical protein